MKLKLSVTNSLKKLLVFFKVFNFYFFMGININKLKNYE